MTLFPVAIKRQSPPGETMAARLQAVMTQPKAVLSVDDDPMIQEYFEAVGREFNVRFVHARSCAEARRLIAYGEQFRGIILDVVLTNGDGVRLFSEISHATPSAQVVFLTGHDSPDLRARVEKIGPARVYSKDAMLQPDFAAQLLLQFGISRVAA